MSSDIRWKQRFDNFDRAFVLLREVYERNLDLVSTGEGRRHPAFRGCIRAGMEDHQGLFFFGQCGLVPDPPRVANIQKTRQKTRRPMDARRTKFRRNGTAGTVGAHGRAPLPAALAMGRCYRRLSLSVTGVLLIVTGVLVTVAAISRMAEPAL